MANQHLVIIRKPYLDEILSGRKTIESRFGKSGGPVFLQVQAGDILFLKQSSGPVYATAKASAVKHLEDLTPQKIAELKRLYNNQIRATEDYWRSKKHWRYGVLIWLADVKRIEPVWIDKRDWRGWVVLSVREHFGLLKHK